MATSDSSYIDVGPSSKLRSQQTATARGGSEEPKGFDDDGHADDEPLNRSLKLKDYQPQNVHSDF
jgi:hypothetical protein